MSFDPLMEPIWNARELLVEKHGGAEAFFDHVIQLDSKTRQRKRVSSTVANRTSSAPPPSDQVPTTSKKTRVTTRSLR